MLKVVGVPVVDVYGLGPAGSSFVIAYAKRRPDASIYAYDLSLDKLGKTRSICAGGLGIFAINKILKYLPEAKYPLYKATKTWVKALEYIGDRRVLIEHSDLGLPYLGVVLDRQEFDMELAKMALKHVNSDKPTGGSRVYATGFTGAPKLPPGDVEILLQYWVETRDVSDVLRLVYIKRYTSTGYYWEFPEAKTGIVKAGVGMSLEEMRRRGVTLHQVIDKYMRLTGLNGKVVKIMGATLPLTKWRREYTFRDNGIYIGTAGCLVNPATGAGIKLAILSGVALATGDEKLFKGCVREVNLFYRLKQWVSKTPQAHIDTLFAVLSKIAKCPLSRVVLQTLIG
jgi:flavin-dependent dehydrogenase